MLTHSYWVGTSHITTIDNQTFTSQVMNVWSTIHSPSSWKNMATVLRVMGIILFIEGCIACLSPAPIVNLTWGPPEKDDGYSHSKNSHLNVIIRSLCRGKNGGTLLYETDCLDPGSSKRYTLSPWNNWSPNHTVANIPANKYRHKLSPFKQPESYLFTVCQVCWCVIVPFAPYLSQPYAKTWRVMWSFCHRFRKIGPGNVYIDGMRDKPQQIWCADNSYVITVDIKFRSLCCSMVSLRFYRYDTRP